MKKQIVFPLEENAEFLLLKLHSCSSLKLKSNIQKFKPIESTELKESQQLPIHLKNKNFYANSLKNHKCCFCATNLIIIPQTKTKTLLIISDQQGIKQLNRINTIRSYERYRQQLQSFRHPKTTFQHPSFDSRG